MTTCARRLVLAATLGAVTVHAPLACAALPHIPAHQHYGEPGATMCQRTAQ